MTLAAWRTQFEWYVSLPAVRVVIGSALTVITFPLLLEMTLFMGVLFMHFFKFSVQLLHLCLGFTSYDKDYS